jgi:hypothetical protein
LPACKQICYNRFSPMSHHRLWSLQILVISIPVLIFSFIAAMSNAKFNRYKETIAEFEKLDEDVSIDRSASIHPSEDYQRQRVKYVKAKNKTRRYKEKTVRFCFTNNFHEKN